MSTQPNQSASLLDNVPKTQFKVNITVDLLTFSVLTASALMMRNKSLARGPDMLAYSSACSGLVDHAAALYDAMTDEERAIVDKEMKNTNFRAMIESARHFAIVQERIKAGVPVEQVLAEIIDKVINRQGDQSMTTEPNV